MARLSLACEAIHPRDLVANCFKGAGAEAIQGLFSSAVTRKCKKNEVIYFQDDEAFNLHFVIEGHVRLSYIMEDGSFILYALLPPGGVFGELGIFDGGPQYDMATSADESVIGSIDARKFKSLCERFPDLRQSIGMLIAQRFRSYIELMRIMSFRRLPTRVAMALLRIADCLGQHAMLDGVKHLCVSPSLTQSDLAIMARGSRGNVNRILKAWERAGWIAMRSRTIVIRKRSALEELAFEDGL